MTATLRFSPGQVLVTPGALAVLAGDSSSGDALLRRHLGGDWGEACPEDQQANEEALREGSRLMSVYAVKGVKVWIITEADRSATTILLPEEY